MREVKFRALSKGKWVYGFYAHKPYGDIEQHFIIDWRINTAGSMPDTYFNDNPVNPETIGQYTGLLDKNGKEIYEGDIITVGNLIGAVEYSEAWTSFTIRTPKSKILEFRLLCDLDVRDEEVIGYIHENPELLQEDEQ